MPSNSKGPATDASVLGIGKLCASADQPTSIIYAHTATSRRTSLFLPSRHIAGREEPAHCKKAAAMESQLKIR